MTRGNLFVGKCLNGEPRRLAPDPTPTTPKQDTTGHTLQMFSCSTRALPLRGRDALASDLGVPCSDD